MQYQVPQGIDLEDKIIGPLTLIQFLYLLIGGVIIYLLFLATHGSLIFWVLGLPIGIVSLSMAFLKIQDQPLTYFIKAAVGFLSRPRIRLWQREGISRRIVQAPVKKIALEKPAPKRRIEKSELEKLAYTLDTQNAGPQIVK